MSHDAEVKLLKEIKPFIAPTSADLMKLLDLESPQVKAYQWLKSDKITQTPGRLTHTVGRTICSRSRRLCFWFCTDRRNQILERVIPFAIGPL